MAEIQPPVENRLNYVPGTDVGVPGGIDRFQPGGADDRTNIFNILDYGGVGDGTTNNRTAFTNLIDAATLGVAYLPAGTWYIGGGGLNLQRFDRQLTLRGAGKGLTTLLLSGSLEWGAGSNWADTYYERDITAGLEKGSTVLTVTGSTADFAVGNIVRITVGNRTTVGNRVMASGGGDGLQRVTNRVAGKTSSTITLLHPLADDLSGRSFAKIVRTNYNEQPTLTGVEHLTIDSNYSAIALISLNTCYGGWFKDVRFRRPANYSLALQDCINMEVRRCEFVEGTNGSSNHAHLLLNNSANNLIVDSFFDHSFPNIEKNSGSTGNAFVDLGLRDSGGGSYITHGPHDSHNLWEGCAVPLWQSDGYFGSESHMNLFRNWFYGQWVIGGAFNVGQVYNRFGRKIWQAANIFGTPGEGNGVQAFGNPNIGNGNSTGVVSELATKATLTTRTSASVGTITGPSGHTVTTGQTIMIAWVTPDSTVSGPQDRTVYKRQKVLVGTVSGTSIPISAGGGDDLPSASSEVWIPNTNAALRFPWSVVSGDNDAGGSGISAYQPQDLDTLFSSTLVANRAVDGSGNGAIIGGQELESGETIPSSMVYGEAKPNYFGDLAWPAFDVLTPGTVNILRCPAAYRYINGTEVPGYDGGSGGGLPTSNPIRSARFPQRALIRAL